MASSDPEATAIDALEEIGLSAYAARTFVAPTGLGSGTAKDVADVSEVPRTRVYDAEEEIVYTTVEGLLTDALVDDLREAADQGVRIRLAGSSPTVQEEIRERVPGAELFESLWVWSDPPAGRLTMVDGERTLISVVTDGPEESHDGSHYETAIWGTGDRNSLVVVLWAVFTWRLGDGEDR